MARRLTVHTEKNFMAFMMPPTESQWYRHLGKGYPFQVVAVDQDARTVELQHFDGDLEEMDLDEWFQLDIEPIEPPEDWTGPMDDIERDDLGYTETDMTGKDYTEPLEEHVGKKKEEGEQKSAEERES